MVRPFTFKTLSNAGKTRGETQTETKMSALKAIMSGASLMTIAALAADGKAGGTSMLKKTELKAIREAFTDSQGHELKLTDQAVSDIVNKVENWDDMDGDEQMALFVKAEEVFAGIAISDPTITGIVNRFDDQFEAELTENIDATIKAKASTLATYCQFKRLFKAQEMDAFPYPGKEASDVIGTNYKPDIVERKAVAGGTIRTVFTDDLVAAMPRGKAYQADIDNAKKELAEPGTGGPTMKGKSKKELRAIMGAATQARNAIRTMVRRAIQFHHQLRAIEGMPKVSFEFMKGTGDKAPRLPVEYGQDKKVQLVSLAPKPLWFMPRDEETGKDVGSEGRDLSITQVLAFDVPKAIKMGGSLTDLYESAKGEPETPETKVLTPEQQDDSLVTLWANLSKRDEMAAFRKRLNAPDSEDIKEAVCAFFLLLQPIYRANEAWYKAKLDGDGTQKETPAKAVA